MCTSDVLFTEITMLSNRIADYPLVSQGKTRIPGVNDSEQFQLTIVSRRTHAWSVLRISELWSQISDIHITLAPCESSKGFFAQVFSTRKLHPCPARALPFKTNMHTVTLGWLELGHLFRIIDDFKQWINDAIYLADMCLLSNNVHDYHIVSQGKVTIPNVDDGEECLLTDVS